MKRILWLLGLCCCLPLGAKDDTQPVDEGAMLQWTSYASYFNPTDLVLTKQQVFELAEGSLFSVNQQDGTITCWNKQNGMHGGVIKHIAYVEAFDQVLVIYDNNLIDLISPNGEIEEVPDLYQTTSTTINIQTVYVHKTTAYIGTTFGVIALNLKKKEVAETYYIGPNASAVSVIGLAIARDSLFALSKTDLYKASLSSQLVNYNNWTQETLPRPFPTGITVYQNDLWLLLEDKLYQRAVDGWKPHLSNYSFLRFKSEGNKLLLTDYEYHLFEPSADTVEFVLYLPDVATGIYNPQTQRYWVISKGQGLIDWDKKNLLIYNLYIPDGPARNDVFLLHFAGEKLFVCPGARWTAEKYVSSTFAFYKDGQWGYETDKHTQEVLGVYPTDLVSVAVDPNDDSHFFMATYSRGVLEYRNNKIYKQYTEGTPKCPLMSLIENAPDYVRTDAITWDDGYLWLIQTESRPYTINVMNTATGQWASYNLSYKGQRLTPPTVKGFWIDKRDSHYKWFISQRSPVGVVLINDNGTPMKGSDDRVVYRNEVHDQNNELFSLTRLNDMAQDRNGDFWVTMQGGVFIIPAETDFFSSDACKRIIIPRNDGTGLADYLLANDNVTAIAVDGGNRKWLGTEGSGLYLVSEDGLTTIHHFTMENSALLSNNITSIAIHPTSGEVFVGTSDGLVSFRSDAAEPFESFDKIVAYPNPIRPNYDGVVTITGLIDQTDVNIIDQAGQLVCKTRSNGGIAVWDLHNAAGKRVTSGIYTALCNAPDGKHGLVKILVMNR